MSKTAPNSFLPRPQKPRYKQQYGVIVICRGELDQAVTYRALQRRYRGREIKVVVT